MINYKNLEYRVSKLENFLLNEGKQVGTLYHVCTLEAYLKYILPTDSLSASGKYNNWLYGSNDYISFTRDKYFVVESDSIEKASVLIQLVIDGDRLSNNYKVRPYNDYHYDYDGNAIDDGDLIKYREKEEVVKGPIKNISKYIKAINFDVLRVNETVIELLSNNNLPSNISYYNFIKSDIQNKSFKDFARSNGIHNGLNIDDTIAIFSEYVNSCDVEKLLFSDEYSYVEYAMQLGVDVNRKYSHGYVLPYYCNDDSYSDIVEILLLHNADIYKCTLDNKTPLMIAAENNAISIVRLLLEYDDDKKNNINIVNKSNGFTALTYAVIKDRVSIAQMLIDAGADVNVIDNKGISLNEYAVSIRMKKLLMNKN